MVRKFSLFLYNWNVGKSSFKHKNCDRLEENKLPMSCIISTELLRKQIALNEVWAHGNKVLYIPQKKKSNNGRKKSHFDG